MKKVLLFKRCAILFFVALLICTALVWTFGGSKITTLSASAMPSTAAVKGFQVNDLEYIGDKENQDLVLITDKYKYGTFSMWEACYKVIYNEPNGTQTCYYFVLVESSICSVGHIYSKRYMRNRDLTISIRFYSPRYEFSRVCYAPQADNPEISKGFSVGVNASAGAQTTVGSNIGANLGATVGASVSVSNVTYHNTVTLTPSAKTEALDNVYDINGNQIKASYLDYNFHFTQYTNGAMVGPNIGLVTEKTVTVFSVKNYTGIDDFNLQISTNALIFKDAKWPLSNATGSGTVTHRYLNGALQSNEETNVCFW